MLIKEIKKLDKIYEKVEEDLAGRIERVNGTIKNATIKAKEYKNIEM